MKSLTALKKPFGSKDSFSRVKMPAIWVGKMPSRSNSTMVYASSRSRIQQSSARNKISRPAVPIRVSVPDKYRSHFRIDYDTGEIAEVSWEFIRELPPTAVQLKSAQESRQYSLTCTRVDFFQDMVPRA